jgi:hypothetical protein
MRVAVPDPEDLEDFAEQLRHLAGLVTTAKVKEASFAVDRTLDEYPFRVPVVVATTVTVTVEFKGDVP